jgi:hypothetical protein
MSIIYSDDSDVIYWPETDLHDTLSSKYYFIDYRPDFWLPNSAYVKGVDVIIPTISNGCMYECLSGGRSSLTEPTFTTKEYGAVQDNDVSWRTIPFDAKLGYGDTITASSWTATAGVTITGQEIVDGKTTLVKVTSVLPTLKTFKLINIVDVLRVTGRTETHKKTISITIGTL